MRKLTVVGAALMAIFAFGVMAVTASAEELPLLLTVPATSSGTSGTSSIFFEGTELRCSNATNSFGTISDTLGTFKIILSACKNGGKSCISLGQTLGSGIIEETGEWHLVRLFPSHRTHRFLWLLLAASDNTEALHIECEVAGLLLIWGNLLALVEVISELTWKLNVEKEGAGATVKQKSTQTRIR